MPCPYPTRSPDSAPAARRARVARRLAAGASVAEVAALEDIANSVVLSLLEEPGFQRLVEDYRAERELPEDERERLLIQSAWAGLLSLADMGDTKALLFVAYEGNRGRHPENRLRRLASFCHLAEAARESSSDCDGDEAGGAVVAGAAEASGCGAGRFSCRPRRIHPGGAEPGGVAPPSQRQAPGPAGREQDRGERDEETNSQKTLGPQRRAAKPRRAGPPTPVVPRPPHVIAQPAHVIARPRMHRPSSPGSTGGSGGRGDARAAWKLPIT